MGHWGRVANGRGGHGSSYLHRIMFFCSTVFCRGFRMGKGFGPSYYRICSCSWGVPWGRGARVEVRRELGIGGVLPLAAGGMGPHAFTASCSFALLSFFKGFRRDKGLGSDYLLLLGSAMGPGCTWLPHEGLANGEGGRGQELLPPGAVLRQACSLGELRRKVCAWP